MKQIYKAPMRQIRIKYLEINDGAIKNINYETPIIRKDLLFYKSWAGAYISFEHETRLPDFYEARDYVEDILVKRDENLTDYPTCPYVSEEEYEYSHEISKETFKALKKYYKSLRKEKKRSR